MAVLEARDRVGGRLLNHDLGDGQVPEIGRQFASPTQDHILASAKRVGVTQARGRLRHTVLADGGPFRHGPAAWRFAHPRDIGRHPARRWTGGVLMGCLGGREWRKWAHRPVDERREAVLRSFAQVVGERAFDTVDYVEQDWTAEQWTQGGPTSVAAPGRLPSTGRGWAGSRSRALGGVRVLPLMERPHGRRGPLRQWPT
ncbi:FAD-dependent oxidoreductase [Streptomyces collinus]